MATNFRVLFARLNAEVKSAVDELEVSNLKSEHLRSISSELTNVSKLLEVAEKMFDSAGNLRSDSGFTAKSISAIKFGKFELDLFNYVNKGYDVSGDIIMRLMLGETSNPEEEVYEIES